MNVLFLQKRLLFPVDAGWRVRTLNIVRHLARWHHVTYLCNLQDEDAPHVASMAALGLRLETTPWREAPRHGTAFYRDLAVNLLSRYPFTVDKDFDPALRARASALLAEGEYDVVVCDFVQMARNLLGLELPASVLFQHNVEAQVLSRHVSVSASVARRAYMYLQWRKMREFEGHAARAFDLVAAVSEDDRRTFETAYGLSNVRVIDTGVDTASFTPPAERPSAPRLVFVGSLDWLPNEDGLTFFASAVWPHVRRLRPDAECEIVGRNPSAAIRRLARTEGFRLSANVPDVRPHLSAAAVSVVPLRIGGGTRLKIFESMAMGTPVVSTTLGAEGLPVESGRHLLLADDPVQFAEAVVTLLANPDMRRALADRARALVVERFSAETVAHQFEAICQEAIERHRASTAPLSLAV